MMRPRRLSVALITSSFVAALALGAAVACSSSTTSDSPPQVTPGTEAGSGPDAETEAGIDAPITGPTQTGRIIDAIGKTAVAGATVTIGGKSVVTHDDGTYAIGITKDVPTTMVVTEADHYKLNEQEWIVKTDLFARGDTSLLSNATATSLSSLLPPRDAAKGLLAVRVYPLAPCMSEQDATLTLEPAGTAKLTYFAGGFPAKNKTSVTKDQAFSGVFSDVDVNVPLKVTVTSPNCEQVAFPVDYDGVTLTGNMQAEPGEVVSYIRVFIGPKKIPDAGAD